MRIIAFILGAIGLVGICLAFYVNQQVASTNRVATFMGGDVSSNVAPWVVGGVSAVLIIAAIVLLVMPKKD